MNLLFKNAINLSKTYHKTSKHQQKKNGQLLRNHQVNNLSINMKNKPVQLKILKKNVKNQSNLRVPKNLKSKSLKL
jgi:hypothetical protein